MKRVLHRYNHNMEYNLNIKVFYHSISGYKCTGNELNYWNISWKVKNVVYNQIKMKGSV